MCPALWLKAVLVDETEIRFVYECGRVERIVALPASAMLPGQVPQLLIYVWK
jgi:hypothetical protein